MYVSKNNFLFSWRQRSSLVRCGRKKGADVVTCEVYNRPRLPEYPWAASDGHHIDVEMWLPPEVSPVLTHVLKGNVGGWVAGHLLNYVLRLNDENQKLFDQRTEEVRKKFIHPIAGIHCRRTDHIVEAPFREIPEYLKGIEQWWEKHNITEKRIYLASDDQNVLKETPKKFPKIQWIIYEYKNPQESGANSSDRGGSRDNTLALLADVFFLSQVDHFEGTSSSQVGRMAYEIMHTVHGDGAPLFNSLDDPWYFP